jgi:hypothetical protein
MGGDTVNITIKVGTLIGAHGGGKALAREIEPEIRKIWARRG